MSTQPTYQHARDTAGGWASLEAPAQRFQEQLAALGDSRRTLAQAVARWTAGA